MLSGKKLLTLFILILLTLFLRDLPYVNVTFIGKMWLIYFALLLFTILVSIRFRVIFLWYATFVLFFAALILTLLRLPFFAESVGVLIYFLLWAIVIYRLMSFIKGWRPQ